MQKKRKRKEKAFGFVRNESSAFLVISIVSVLKMRIWLEKYVLNT